MAQYIVDCQGFFSSYCQASKSSRFVFKELAILNLNENSAPRVFVFKPPHCWDCLDGKDKRSDKFVATRYHGMSWNIGDIPYSRLFHVLFYYLRNAEEIYVKGDDKIFWLREYLPTM